MQSALYTMEVVPAALTICNVLTPAFRITCILAVFDLFFTSLAFSIVTDLLAPPAVLIPSVLPWRAGFILFVFIFLQALLATSVVDPIITDLVADT